MLKQGLAYAFSILLILFGIAGFGFAFSSVPFVGFILIVIFLAMAFHNVVYVHRQKE
jgi:hypothetical protein